MSELEERIDKFNDDSANLSRALRFLLALDQMFNVILWNGSHDETISSHIGRRIKNGRANWFDKIICKFLRFIENKHCINSIGE